MNGAKAPDPFQTAMTQSMFNTQAAKQQQALNMTSQNTPYGALTYTADPNSPSGYTANQTYTPEVQALLRGNIGNSQAASDTAGSLLRNGQGVLSNPVDTSWNGTASRIADINKSFLDPIWSQRQNDFDQTMANRGLVPGSQAYTNAARDFGMQRDNSYNNMGLGAYTAGVNANLQQQASALNAMNALRNGSMIAQPVSQGTNFTTTPQESIQPVNYSQLVNQNYQNQQAQNNATMGGLFGLGGTVLGGLAGGPIGAGFGKWMGSSLTGL